MNHYQKGSARDSEELHNHLSSLCSPDQGVVMEGLVGALQPFQPWAHKVGGIISPTIEHGGKMGPVVTKEVPWGACLWSQSSNQS